MATEIRYINNSGGGFNGRKTIEDGTTIERFFAQVMPGEERGRYNIRVNNAVPVEGQVLRGGDLVSIIPGKYDGGGLFGGEFIKNLQAAAELGKLARQTPDLANDLKAINDLGVAIKAVPDLAGNITAVVEFVKAVQVLDQPTGAPEPEPGRFDTGIDLSRPPVVDLSDEARDFLAGVTNSDLAELKSVLLSVGGVAALKEQLRTKSHGTDAAVAAPAVLVGSKEIDTTPPAPGCVRLVTGMGIGRAERIEEGETMEHFFNRMKPGHRPESYRIEVNGTTADPDQRLKEGDSVLIRDINAVRGKLAGGSSAL